MAAPVPPQQQQDWPDRRVEILLSTVIIAILSTLVLIWRVVYGVVNRRKLLVCDYLLIIAAVSGYSITQY